MTTGIYSIQLGDVCLYVGQSLNVERRQQSHRSALRHGRANDLLQWVYDHRTKDFDFELRQTCYMDELNDAEEWWTRRLHPWCNGFSWCSARTWGWPPGDRVASYMNHNRHFRGQGDAQNPAAPR